MKDKQKHAAGHKGGELDKWINPTGTPDTDASSPVPVPAPKDHSKKHGAKSSSKSMPVSPGSPKYKELLTHGKGHGHVGVIDTLHMGGGSGRLRSATGTDAAGPGPEFGSSPPSSPTNSKNKYKHLGKQSSGGFGHASNRHHLDHEGNLATATKKMAL